jgi:hypothetical protein
MKTNQTIRLWAYRNGDGHTKAGELIIGSNIPCVSVLLKVFHTPNEMHLPTR